MVDENAKMTRLRQMYDERVQEQDVAHPGYAVAWASFQRVLLSHGGSAVVPPLSPDPLIGMFVQQGRLQMPEGVVMVAGVSSDCHVNAVGLWRAEAAVAVGTGYALSPDGLWREHSWAWDSGGHLIETTMPRTTYFGLRMEGELASWFAEWISPEKENRRSPKP